MLGFKPADELLDEAQRFRENYGITTFKLKTGRRPLSLDVEACRVLREGLARRPRSTWTRTVAGRPLKHSKFCAGPKVSGVSMLEEPCDAGEVLGRRRLVEQSNIPIVGG